MTPANRTTGLGRLRSRYHAKSTSPLRQSGGLALTVGHGGNLGSHGKRPSGPWASTWDRATRDRIVLRLAYPGLRARKDRGDDFTALLWDYRTRKIVSPS
jgi:hypothetical protein